MFKQSRRKIVMSIMSILVLLWVGTLGVIYTSSYLEMTRQNQQMLRFYAERYMLPSSVEATLPPKKPVPDMPKKNMHGFNPEFDKTPMFQLSTFYAVAISSTGDILDIKNDSPTVHTDEDLILFSNTVKHQDKNAGTIHNLAFYKTDKDGYLLVVFVDNTIINARAITLIRYTLIFGMIALLLFFFLSVFLARNIVKPLEESYRKQKQFISDAGHELKTPVSVVSANAELLSREIGDNQWLSNIQYENERMGVLIRQLLDLARTENVIPQMETLDFGHLVYSETLPFESVAFEHGLAINANIQNNIKVTGNQAQLKQLVAILLDNAIRHSILAHDISISVICSHGSAKLSVINDGEEIPPKEREQMFERFYRIDTARNSEDKHYGLGLSIAKAIVTSHKGSIEVLCHDGQIEFKVLLPLTK